MSEVFGARDSIFDDVPSAEEDGSFLDCEFEEALSRQGIRRSAVIDSDESEAGCSECETASEASEASEASGMEEDGEGEEDDDEGEWLADLPAGEGEDGSEGEGEGEGEENDTFLSEVDDPKQVTAEQLASLLARVGVLGSAQHTLLGAHDGRFLLDLVEEYADKVPDAVSSGDLLRASAITLSMYKNSKAIEKMFNSIVKLAVAMVHAGKEDVLANTLRAMENNEVAIAEARAEKAENELVLAKEQLMLHAEVERLLEEKAKLLEEKEHLPPA